VSALGQQGLFEPPPTRRVVSAAEGWWGCDPSTRLFAVATVDRELKRRVHEVRLGEPGPYNGERLARYARQMRQLVEAMLAEGCPRPGAVWVEQASGQHPSPELVYSVGVATLTLYVALRAALGVAVLVETVPSATWKARGLGNGRISKKDPETGKAWRPRERYPVMEWAMLNGYEPRGDAEDWDRCDAMGIAEGCRRSIALAV
jgi:hypothetical protein